MQNCLGFYICAWACIFCVSDGALLFKIYQEDKVVLLSVMRCLNIRTTPQTFYRTKMCCMIGFSFGKLKLLEDLESFTRLMMADEI